MFKRIKGTILAVVAAFFVAMSWGSAAWAVVTSPIPGSSGWSSVGGTRYNLGITPYVLNFLQTIHYYGILLGALMLVWGFLVLHSPSPQHKQHGYSIIIGSVIAFLGLFFSPYIWVWLTSL